MLTISLYTLQCYKWFWNMPGNNFLKPTNFRLLDIIAKKWCIVSLQMLIDKRKQIVILWTQADPLAQLVQVASMWIICMKFKNLLRCAFFLFEVLLLMLCSKNAEMKGCFIDCLIITLGVECCQFDSFQHNQWPSAQRSLKHGFWLADSTAASQLEVMLECSFQLT